MRTSVTTMSGVSSTTASRRAFASPTAATTSFDAYLGRAAARAAQRHRAVDGRDPVGQPDQAGTTAGIGATAAVVAYVQNEPPARHLTGDRGLLGLAVFRDVRQCFHHHEIRRDLDERGEPAGQADVDVDRHRHGGHDLADVCLQAAVGEDLGVYATDQLAQLGERLLRELVGRGDLFGGG
jgi:hypothetical protein